MLRSHCMSLNILLEAKGKRGAQLAFADLCITSVCVWREQNTAGHRIDVHTSRSMSRMRGNLMEHWVCPSIIHAGVMLMN